MNENLTISPLVLKDSATQIRNKIINLKNDLNEATMEVDKVSNSFQGSASESFLNKYNSMKPKFDNFCQEIEEYANFLIKTAEAYEQQDQAIAKKAEDLLS